jgi:hypothetical protein
VDPWYRGEPARRLVLLSNGTVKQVMTRRAKSTTVISSSNAAAAAAAAERQPVPPFDQRRDVTPLNAQHDNWLQRDDTSQVVAITTVTAAAERMDDTNMEENTPTNQNCDDIASHELEYELVDPTITMTWRLLTSPIDLPTRSSGSYVRFTVGGRDVPTYAVRRIRNWGFVMESCWGIYTSFRLPQKRGMTTNNHVVNRDETVRVRITGTHGITPIVSLGRVLTAPSPTTATTTTTTTTAHHPPGHQVENHVPPVVQQAPGRRRRRRLRRSQDEPLWVETDDEDDVEYLEHDNISIDGTMVTSTSGSMLHRERVRIQETRQPEVAAVSVATVTDATMNLDETILPTPRSIDAPRNIPNYTRRSRMNENRDSIISPDSVEALGNDRHLLINNEVQWREAFLYNVGVRSLPEGEAATDEFDRAWGAL